MCRLLETRVQAIGAAAHPRNIAAAQYNVKAASAASAIEKFIAGAE